MKAFDKHLGWQQELGVIVAQTCKRAFQRRETVRVHGLEVGLTQNMCCSFYGCFSMFLMLACSKPGKRRWSRFGIPDFPLKHGMRKHADELDSLVESVLPGDEMRPTCSAIQTVRIDRR